MPKLKPSPIDKQTEIVHMNIVSRGVLFGCKTDREFGAKLNIDPGSFRNRRNNPRLWRLDELTKVCMVFKCSMQWLVTDHSGEIKEE